MEMSYSAPRSCFARSFLERVLVWSEMRRIECFFSFGLCCVSASFGANAIQERVFEAVWAEIDASHYDPEIGGKDWDAIGAAYRARLETVKDAASFDELLGAMLAELGDSHIAIVSPGYNELLPNTWQGGSPGMSIRIAEGQAVIGSIVPGGAADVAGLQAGMALRSIDGERTLDLLDRVQRVEVIESAVPSYWVQAMENRLLGRVGRKIDIGVSSGPLQRSKRIEIQLKPYEGLMSIPLGNVGSMPMSIEYENGEDGIAYLRFDLWMPTLMEDIRRFVRSVDEEIKGLIIDLRGNPGGIGMMSTGLAGMLVEDEFRMGTMRLREGYLNYNVYPQTGAYLGPVAILVDHGSISTSEIFAAGMQETGRARVFGTRTPGAALPSLVKRLPNGYYLQMAIADYETPKGFRIEGVGVTPDETVKLSIRSLRRGSDSVIEAARKWILQRQ